MTFKLKLISTLLVLTTIPLLVTNYMGFKYTEEIIQEEKSDDVQAIINSLEYILLQYKKNAILNLQYLSQSNEIQTFFKYPQNSNKKEELDTFLSTLLQSNDSYLNYRIFDLNAKPIYQVGNIYADLHKNDFVTISKAINTDTVQLSTVYLNDIVEHSVPLIIIPIKKDNTIIGAISTRHNYKPIRDTFLHSNLSKASYPFIMSGDGLIALHPDINITLKKRLLEIIKVDKTNLNILQTQDSGFVEYIYKEKEKILFFKNTPSGKFQIGFTLPKSDFLHYIDDFKYIMIFMITLLVTITILFSIFISNKLSKAMKKVEDSKEDLQEKNRELSQLSAKLAKFLSPQLYESLFHSQKDVVIETYRKQLTIFFSDIKDFSSITENMQAEALSLLLNEYLTEMSDIALRHGGTIDKYIGDAIMVFFGDPYTNGQKNDAVACVSMAIEMCEKMYELQKKWKEQGIKQALHVRMGINTGYCTVGNFGSHERLDYTIIGGAVNVASRLESNANIDKILISHSTYSLIKNEIICLKKGDLQVKGIQNPISVYEIVDFYNKTVSANQIQHDESGFKLEINVDYIDDKDIAIKRLEHIIQKIRSI